jgi:adenylate/nucleoside-diphosphate kinase
LPPVANPIPVSSLPIIGYLEQTVASALNEALGAISKYKPKYPFKSLPLSANEFLGLYLKGKFFGLKVAKNPKSKDWVRNKFEKKLDVFKSQCELIQTLSKDLTGYSDEYLGPEQRPLDLDKKLENLTKLKP